MQGLVKQTNDYGQETTWWSEEEVEAAMCIWEFALYQRQAGDDEVFDWLRGGEGAASARDQCIQLARDCEKSYQVARKIGYDTSFDWEFVPRWVTLAMKITEFALLNDAWIDYIGMEIALEYNKDALPH